MDIKGLRAVLDSTGLPVVYHSFQSSGLKVKQPPYIMYYLKNSDNTGADNKVYYKQNYYNIELYTNKKDIAAEQKWMRFQAHLFFMKKQNHTLTKRKCLIFYMKLKFRKGVVNYVKYKKSY